MQDIKINVQKWTPFLNINNEISEKKLKITIIFPIAQERIKYLGINLTKDIKGLYSENYKALLKEIEKRHNELERYSLFMDWMNQYS